MRLAKRHSRMRQLNLLVRRRHFYTSTLAYFCCKSPSSTSGTALNDRLSALNLPVERQCLTSLCLLSEDSAMESVRPTLLQIHNRADHLGDELRGVAGQEEPEVSSIAFQLCLLDPELHAIRYHGNALCQSPSNY